MTPSEIDGPLQQTGRRGAAGSALRLPAQVAGRNRVALPAPEIAPARPSDEAPT